MTANEPGLPIFLGLSHQAAKRNYQWDLLGLSALLVFPFFPQRISGLQCVLALNLNSLATLKDYSFKLWLTDESQPTSHGWVDCNFSRIEQESSDTINLEVGRLTILPGSKDDTSISYRQNFAGIQLAPESFELFTTPAPPLVLTRPTRVIVEVEIDGKRSRLGELLCAFAAPPPLAEEERRAIASRPVAAKSVACYITCKKCSAEVVYFCQLDPLAPRPSGLPSNAMSLEKAPPTWSCSCGQTVIDLSYMKRGLHEFFRHHLPRSSEDMLMRFLPLYEAGRIQDIITDYEQLLESATKEEPVQEFLEKHPLFWSFLSPSRIMHKPAVLTKKKADFGILTTHKVFYLVEIEKPTTKLTTKSGAISSEIQQGANQIKDWQLTVDDERHALLSELGLKDDEVQEIRYLLVGGLSRRTSVGGLTKLRRSPLAKNTEFLCFDELASFLHTLAGQLRRL